VNGRSSNDVLERFFEWGEAAFCPGLMYKPDELPENFGEPDVLDYVFEHVESFTCRDNGPEGSGIEVGDKGLLVKEGNKGVGNNSFDENFSLVRDNSLVERDGTNGRPTRLATTRKSPKIVPLGQEGDLLDYCFEHVESFVCNEGNEVMPNSSAPIGRPRRMPRFRSHRPNNEEMSSSATDFQQLKRDVKKQSQRERGSWFGNGKSSPSRSTGESTIPSEITTTPSVPSSIHCERDSRSKCLSVAGDEEDEIQLYFRPMKSAGRVIEQ